MRILLLVVVKMKRKHKAPVLDLHWCKQTIGANSLLTMVDFYFFILRRPIFDPMTNIRKSGCFSYNHVFLYIYIYKSEFAPIAYIIM